MFNWFRNLKIRNKLIIAFILTILFSLVISLTALIIQGQMQTKSANQLAMENRIAGLNAQMEVALLMVRRAEKDYLLRYKDVGLEEARKKYVNRVKKYVQEVHHYIQEIEKMERHSEHSKLVGSISQSISNYETTFMKVVDLIEVHGFKDTGMEGEFRKHAHAIEKFVNEKGMESIERDMLMIRRHEKDFLLRADNQYVDKLVTAIKHLQEDVDEHGELNATEKQELITLMDNYQTAFMQLVQIDKQITDNIKIFRSASHKLEPFFEKIATESAEHKQEAQLAKEESDKFVMMLVVFMSIAAMIINILIAVLLANWISKPLRLIVHEAQLLAAGDTKLEGIDQSILEKIIHNQDEVGEIAYSFNILSNRFKGIIEDIVQALGGLARGNLDITPQAQYTGDFLKIKISLETNLSNLRLIIADIVQMSQNLAEGKQVVTQIKYQGDFTEIKNALEIASSKLIAAKIKNDSETWLKIGQTELNDLMSGEQKIAVLAKKVISFLTTYVEAQIGLFYLVAESDSAVKKVMLKRIADYGYAYSANKNLPKEFEIDNGLVGQAVLEKKTLLRTYKPNEYQRIIQSGLINTVPRYILLIPFLYEKTVKGVIELGAHKAFSAEHRDFLDQAMPRIGIAINMMESREKMEILLSKSQQQAKELRTSS